MKLFLRHGIWYIKKQVRGRQVWRSTGEANYKRAERRAIEIIHSLNDGKLGWNATTPTFAEWWLTYSPTYSEPHVSAKLDALMIQPALAFFGPYALSDIRRSLCQRYLAQREAKYASSTVQRERQFLQAIFQRAVDDGILDRNPWKGIPRLEYEPRMRVLSRADQLRLMQEMTPRFRRWLLFMLGTGVRLDEACRVHPADIDFALRTIQVQGKRKPRAAELRSREIPLFPEVQVQVEQQLLDQGKLWNANPQNYRDAMATYAKRAGIPHLSPHDLRHTFATRWVEQGGDIYLLSEILGHSTIEMTRRVYVHAGVAPKQRAKESLDLGLADLPRVLPFDKVG